MTRVRRNAMRFFPFQFGSSINIAPSYGSKWGVAVQNGDLVVTHDVKPIISPTGVTGQVSRFVVVERFSMIVGGQTVYESFSIPLWVPTILFAAYPTIALLRIPARRRSWRRQHGRCEKCGYDLTGNTSGVCPECGTPVPQGVTDKAPTNGGQV